LVVEDEPGVVEFEKDPDVVDASPREGEVLWKILGADDDARNACRRKPQLLALVELGILKRGDAPETRHQRGRKTRLLHEEALGEDRLDLRWDGEGQLGRRGRGPRRFPRRIVFFIIGSWLGDAQYAPRARRLFSQCTNPIALKALDVGEELPRLLPRKRLEAAIDEQAVPQLPRVKLKR